MDINTLIYAIIFKKFYGKGANEKGYNLKLENQWNRTKI